MHAGFHLPGVKTRAHAADNHGCPASGLQGRGCRVPASKPACQLPASAWNLSLRTDLQTLSKQGCGPFKHLQAGKTVPGPLSPQSWPLAPH